MYCTEKKNDSMNTMNRLSNCIALLRKEVLRRSAKRVQGLPVVQMIVSVNVSLGLFVSWLSERCVMSSEPSDTLIISPQMPSLWWWQAEVIVLHRPCEFLFFRFSRNHSAECPRDFQCGCNGTACTQSPIHNAMRNLSDPLMGPVASGVRAGDQICAKRCIKMHRFTKCVTSKPESVKLADNCTGSFKVQVPSKLC